MSKTKPWYKNVGGLALHSLLQSHKNRIKCRCQTCRSVRQISWKEKNHSMSSRCPENTRIASSKMGPTTRRVKWQKENPEACFNRNRKVYVIYQQSWYPNHIPSRSVVVHVTEISTDKTDKTANGLWIWRWTQYTCRYARRTTPERGSRSDGNKASCETGLEQ